MDRTEAAYEKTFALSQRKPAASPRQIFFILTILGSIVWSSAGLGLCEPLPRREAPVVAANDGAGTASAKPQIFLKNLALDQKQIWTSPFKARIEDLNWLVPLIGPTAGMVNADAELSSRLDTTGTFARHSSTIANAGLAAALGGSGSLFLLGKLRSDDHQREAGIISVEAASDSLLVTEALKLVTRRERPSDGTGQGRFFRNGSLLNSSFPSTHAMLAWSVASVLAHEYPAFFPKTMSYALATGVSMARVYGKDHFPSDVLVGSVAGWLIGRQIYADHHDSSVPGGGWGTFHRDSPGEGHSSEVFSPYVSLDSWVYPALERLQALGTVNTALLGQRPWTRAECARILEEGRYSTSQFSQDEGSRLYAALENEFAPELNGRSGEYLRVDSLYLRVTSIAGPPLTDDYHFGRTLVNDFGRPFQRGTNALAGFSASGSSGALGFSVRGEFEHAPSAAGYSQAVQDAIQFTDVKPAIAASPIPAFNQFRLLDTYVSLNVKSWQASFGKETLWTGPGLDPFLWSDNAEPVYMFRLDQSAPRTLPGLLSFLGPVRSEFWIGKLTGHHFVDTQDGNVAVTLGRTLARQPMVNGVKFDFKPTPNLEFGLGRTGMWGGPDFPITVGSTGKSLFSGSNAVGRGNDPGDRRSTFNFSYRLPGLRQWVTLYEDSFVEDEISPIGYPRRAAHSPGIYISQFPMARHLDLRIESGFTNLPGLIEPIDRGGFFYWNVRYLDGYTNKGTIIGDGTVGRQGISLRAESTYWFSADRTIQLGYRSNTADPMFLQGGNLKDAYLHSEWNLQHGLFLSTFLQDEHWNFPLLSPGKPEHNFTVSFQLTLRPNWTAQKPF